jgi:hypothetical protein
MAQLGKKSIELVKLLRESPRTPNELVTALWHGNPNAKMLLTKQVSRLNNAGASIKYDGTVFKLEREFRLTKARAGKKKTARKSKPKVVAAQPQTVRRQGASGCDSVVNIVKALRDMSDAERSLALRMAAAVYEVQL